MGGPQSSLTTCRGIIDKAEPDLSLRCAVKGQWLWLQVATGKFQWDIGQK